MESIIYKTRKLSETNTLHCEIEKTFMDSYSVLVYNTDGDLWIEKFALTYEEATIVADKLLKKNY